MEPETITAIWQSCGTLTGVLGIIHWSLKPIHDKLDQLNSVDAKLEEGIKGHGHRGLKGDENKVVIENP